MRLLPSVPPSWRRGAAALVLAAGVGGCAGMADLPAPDAVRDPLEAGNRKVHAFNVGVDRAVVQPLLGGEGSTAGDRLRRGVRNVAHNLDGPRLTANHLLQGRFVEAGQTVLRFGVNSVVGAGGLLDPATAMGLPRRDTDFGETLHVWGVGEGVYHELPFLGPTTTRDWAGEMVDILANPIRPFLSVPQNRGLTAVNALGEVADLSRAAGALGDILSGSADSYAQVRLIYLQNRRFELRRNAERVAARRGSAPTGPGVPDDPYAALPEIAGPGLTDAPDPAADPAPPSDRPAAAPEPTPLPVSDIDPYEDPYAF